MEFYVQKVQQVKILYAEACAIGIKYIFYAE